MALLALVRGDDTGQEGALLLGEQQRRHVGRALDDGVDQAELDVRELRRDDLHRLGVGEADTDDRVEALGRELAQTGLLGRLVLVRGGGELARVLLLDAHVRDGLVQTGGGGVVERRVATTTDVVGQTDLQRARVHLVTSGSAGVRGGRRGGRRGELASGTTAGVRVVATAT